MSQLVLVLNRFFSTSTIAHVSVSTLTIDSSSELVKVNEKAIKLHNIKDIKNITIV